MKRVGQMHKNNRLSDEKKQEVFEYLREMKEEGEIDPAYFVYYIENIFGISYILAKKLVNEWFKVNY